MKMKKNKKIINQSCLYCNTNLIVTSTSVICFVNSCCSCWSSSVKLGVEWHFEKIKICKMMFRNRDILIYQ